MEELTLEQSIAVSAAVLILALIGMALFRRFIRRSVEREKLTARSAKRVRRVFNVILLLLLLIAAAATWGPKHLQNLWVALTGILGLVAIGFVALWSILSNVVAGAFLMIFRPFVVGDRVEILPDEFSGEVIDITAMFVVLAEEEGHLLHVPNSMVFQKAIRRVRGERHVEGG